MTILCTNKDGSRAQGGQRSTSEETDEAEPKREEFIDSGGSDHRILKDRLLLRER